MAQWQTQAEMLQNMLSTLAQGQENMQRVIANQAETQQRLDANLQTALSQLGEAKDVILQQQAELVALKASTGAATAEGPSTAPQLVCAAANDTNNVKPQHAPPSHS